MRPLAAGLLCSLVLAAPASAQDVTFPVLGTETKRGTGTLATLPASAPVTKTVDGAIGDWAGTGPGFAGTVVRSRGELISTDHLFDAYGADDGRDAERLATMGPAHDGVPETYRLEALLQQDPAGEFGVPVPDQFRYTTHYGDLEREDVADLSQVRVAAEGRHLLLLARTTTMKSAADTAVLVLLDDDGAEGSAPRDVPFGSGLTSARAERAVLLAGARGWVADLKTGAVTALPAGSVATRPDGYDNAVEVRIPHAFGASRAPISIAVAAGRQSAAGDGLANVANVAFRTDEPVREWFDKHQALALLAGTIDPFFRAVDPKPLAAGASERWSPGPGYHERVFTSTDAISKEEGEDGILQPYGVYLPAGFDAAKAAPLQLWLHWRGGKAHSAGAAIPGMFRDLGDRHGTIVVSPRGRGSSSWYVGRGHVDVEQVWADVHDRFRIDADRRYVSGHSMGGWGSFLMTIAHPDWFAAALPASPPVTQGAWTGLDFEGCEEMQFEEYTPCYIEANDGDARAQHTRRLLENLRHIPVAIQTGVEDELVPFSGVARQAERLVQLGYRHRLYGYLTQEHYGPPVWDQWGEGGRYMHQFTRPAKPSRITHVRDLVFERAIERGFDFDFGRNRWLTALEPAADRATFDGKSLAVPATDPLVVPEAGGPASTDQTGPYVVAGLRWVDNPLGTLPAARNAFEATLTGARAATLDPKGMGLNTALPITATVTTDAPLELTVAGVGTRTVPAGTHALTFG